MELIYSPLFCNIPWDLLIQYEVLVFHLMCGRSVVRWSGFGFDHQCIAWMRLFVINVFVLAEMGQCCLLVRSLAILKIYLKIKYIYFKFKVNGGHFGKFQVLHPDRTQTEDKQIIWKLLKLLWEASSLVLGIYWFV